MQFQPYYKIIKIVFSIFILSSSLLLQSQIVNVENLRHENDSIGWSGYARADMEIEKNNTARIFNLTNQVRLQHQGEKSLWFFIHDMNYKIINGGDINNNTTQHLRFSHSISPKVSYEAFLQSQSDRVSEIKLRALVGTGLRFHLYEAEAYKFYLGTTLMYEYENSVNEVENIRNDIRKSMYLSFKIKPTKNISLVSTNYYQPLLNKFSDFRLLSESSVILKLFKKLSFISTFRYQYDSFPVKNVANEQFKLTQGLVYFFD